MTNSKNNLSNEQIDEINALRNSSSETIRPVAKGIEEILYKVFPALDHGFVRVVDYMGDDQAIVQAARVSYGKGTSRVSEDRGLIRYLMRHRHSTPFEMCEIKLHVKLPMFIARQWIRHRTASINEYSARYSVLDKEFYIPEEKNLAVQSKLNKQGRGDTLTPKDSKEALFLLKRDAEKSYETYEYLLNENPEGDIVDKNRDGLSRELARINLTLNTYTQWYWKTNLHNLMNFIFLRADSHAQYEIRVYADIIYKIMESWVPITAEAFKSYRSGSVELSAEAMQVVRQMLDGQQVDQKTSGLSVREWNELLNHLK
ncbi:MAG: thymidylate synthase (FAD) [Pelagibacterales bacterium]|nr:thymidylate synthase (FAD) [Pelagibacterales bacterium]PPR16165.1 MAG: Thymidylate synthase ThyX [Alphaproteobacteria bacterium MarineAlpha9_Bin3]|tara:strand:+ start:214 stop:1158 length:945 start_codon:yes stop_codon:yes gene_type:complete